MYAHARQIVFGVVLAFAAPQVPAQAAAAHKTTGEIAYATGGIGVDERQALKQMEKDFNLKLLFTEPDGHFISDASVVIQNASGKPVLSEQAGPVFLAKLPPGTYTVESTFGGQRQTRKVTVGKQLTTAQFLFRHVTGDVAQR
jgi:hypothetical protein